MIDLSGLSARARHPTQPRLRKHHGLRIEQPSRLHHHDLAAMNKVLLGGAWFRRDRRNQIARGFSRTRSPRAPQGGARCRPHRGCVTDAAVSSRRHFGGCALCISRQFHADASKLPCIGCRGEWSLCVPDSEDNQFEVFTDIEWFAREPLNRWASADAKLARPV